MSNAINEIDNTDLVFVFGYNPADSHPIVANHVINAKRNGAKIIVCDPRKIETARIADMHIALKNGSNIALLNAMGHVIIEENLYDGTCRVIQSIQLMKSLGGGYQAGPVVEKK